MKRLHDIKWFLEDPKRLLEMKPFTRGGSRIKHGFETSKVLNTTVLDTGVQNMQLQPVSQDLYLTEYYPDLHSILHNQSIPKIQVRVGGVALPTEMLQITQTASFQKLIHSAHVRNLTVNPLEFNIYNDKADESEIDLFGKIKQEWMVRDMEWYRYQAINTCKQVGNCALLFYFDKDKKRYGVRSYSYEDGYQIIPNYDEFGDEIAVSITYQVDEKTVIDTYDDTHHYRTVMNSSQTTTEANRHGFPECPVVHKRGKVAWEYAESSIEMWELMSNIYAIALKRFGTFALALWGELDEESFKRDNSTLIVNLSSEAVNGGKQDVKVLEFPEPKTMTAFLDYLKEDISLSSSTSFITPKDITTTNSGGNGIALAMSNDYAVATQGALDWKRFVCKMVRLHQYGLQLEDGVAYPNIKMGASIIPWSLETNNTKITNLATEAKYLSLQTVVESMPDAKPDEVERIMRERGALVPSDSSAVQSEAERSQRISVNRSNIIRDNE